MTRPMNRQISGMPTAKPTMNPRLEVGELFCEWLDAAPVAAATTEDVTTDVTVEATPFSPVVT